MEIRKELTQTAYKIMKLRGKSRDCIIKNLKISTEEYENFIREYYSLLNVKDDLSFSISEDGLIAFEKYKRQCHSSIKSTISLFIAGISIIISIIAILVA